MAGTGGQPEPDLIQELLRHPEQFEFFQAVRLIERAAGEQSRGRTVNRVGGTEGPDGEAVRFHALASLTFPAGQLASITGAIPSGDSESLPAPLAMTVSFMGLTGPEGALPEHYTSLVIERSHLRLKDHTLRAFLDLFNHRAISLFFRAWEKYRFPFAYERRQQEGTLEEDLFTACLYSVVGMGSRFQRERFGFDDQAILYYGGLFAARFRNAVSLEQLMSDYFRLKADVVQFQGQWLYLPEDSQSSMPSPIRRGGLNLSLGDSAVAGSRVWDVQSRIRIRLGPLSWSQFSALLPGSPGLRSVTEMIRLYVGVDLDFDVQLILKREDVPLCRLSPDDSYRPQLGWNTWLGTGSNSASPAGDAVFRF